MKKLLFAARLHWDRVAAVAAVLLGLVSIVLGWIGVSGHDLVTEQLPYLASGAVFGGFALGIGGTLWLSADIRDEWARLEEIGESLHQEIAALRRQSEAPQEPTPTGHRRDP
jgi:hypothetical protein